MTEIEKGIIESILEREILLREGLYSKKNEWDIYWNECIESDKRVDFSLKEEIDKMEKIRNIDFGKIINIFKKEEFNDYYSILLEVKNNFNEDKFLSFLKLLVERVEYCENYLTGCTSFTWDMNIN